MGEDRAAIDHCVDFARLVLERIVHRLEPMEQELSFSTSYWVGDKEAEEKLQQRMATGLLFLRNALRGACRALVGDDPEDVIISALECQTMFGDGRLLLFKREEATLLSRERGRKSAAARGAWRKPYRDMYRTMVASGVPYLKARKDCMNQMSAGGRRVLKSPTTLNQLFPKPKKISS